MHYVQTNQFLIIYHLKLSPTSGSSLLIILFLIFIQMLIIIILQTRM